MAIAVASDTAVTFIIVLTVSLVVITVLIIAVIYVYELGKRNKGE